MLNGKRTVFVTSRVGFKVTGTKGLSQLKQQSEQKAANRIFTETAQTSPKPLHFSWHSTKCFFVVWWLSVDNVYIVNMLKCLFLKQSCKQSGLLPLLSH